MQKTINILMLLVIISFVLSIFKYYFSNNIKNIKDYNRSNIDEILKNKTNELIILKNDTDNVIKFNDTFESELNNTKKRSFWDLLQNK
tara:strand:- start:143 stop:406 length:264 start_codon:yes stop_codon:yes gene_type:complete